MINNLKNQFEKIDPSFKEVIQGSFAAFTLRVTGTLLVFGVNAYIARELGPHDAGIYFLAMTIITISSQIGRLGLGNSIVRFIASFSAVANWKAVKGIFVRSLQFIIIGTILLTLLLFFLVPNISISIFNKRELIHPLTFMLLLIVPTAIAIHLGEALRGLKKISKAILIQNVSIPVLVLIGLLVFGTAVDIEKLIKIYIAAVTTTAVLGFLLWNKTTPQLKGIKPVFHTAELLDTSKSIFIVSIMYMIILWASTIIMGIYYDNDQVGIFSIAIRTAHLMSFVITSIDAIAAPKIAILYHTQKHSELVRMVKKITRLIVVISLPVLLAFLLYPGLIMSVFGSQYSQGQSVLQILVIGYFVSICTGPVGVLLMMSGNERFLRNITMLTAAINIILCFVLIPRYGIVGAAYATSVCMTIEKILSLLVIRWKLKFWTFPFSICRA